jgi:hypothetical protein
MREIREMKERMTVAVVFVLQVARASGNMKLDSTVDSAQGGECYYGLPIDRSYFSTGVPNADHVVYVTAR